MRLLLSYKTYLDDAPTLHPFQSRPSQNNFYDLPSILLANVRSVLNKLDDIYATIHFCKAHIFAATETWLHDGIENGILKFPNYIHYRQDRRSRRGGGVCVWTHVSIVINHLTPRNELDFIEAVWLSLPSSKLIFVCLYIPPDIALTQKYAIDEYITSNCDYFLSSLYDFDLIICGDFNRFDSNSIVNHLDLVNLVKEPTRNLAMLDYLFVSYNLLTNYKVEVSSPIANSDHNCVHATPTADSSKLESIKKPLYDLRQGNINHFVTELSAINWTPFYKSDHDVDEKCNLFHDLLFCMFHTCIPVRHVEMTAKDKPWLTPLVKHSIQQRWDAFRMKNFPLYHYWKAKTKALISSAKKKWSLKAGNSSKELWRVTNSVRGTKSSDPTFALLKRFDSLNHATNSINSKLTSVFLLQSLKKVDLKEDKELSWNIDISVPLVQKLLSEIKPYKAAGSDQIPSILYKTAAEQLAGPLAHIFNASVSQRKFPKRWKLSHVCPIPKTTPPDLDHLRPISLLPAPSKIFERIVINSVLDQFLENFGPNQFGCRPASSTTCAMIKLLHHAYRLLEAPNVSGVKIIAYDFTKAFDRLSHSLIVERLIEKRFPALFIQWIQDYLSNRKQATRIGCALSSTTAVTSGVPQGSVLGPMLFCFVAGTLRPLYRDTCIIQYVDDTTLCIPIYKNDRNQHVTDEHLNFVKWCKANTFSINFKKCQSIFYSKSPSTADVFLEGVKAAESMRLLGIVLNNKLNWKSHIDSVCRSASRRLYALRILRPIFPSRQLTIVYYAVIRSLLEYASPSFGKLPKKLNKDLQKLQRRCHKLICGFDIGPDKCPCNWFPDLTTRRNSAAVKLFTYATYNKNHILHPIMPPLSKRSQRFIQPPAITTRYLHSFVPFTTTLANGVSS